MGNRLVLAVGCVVVAAATLVAQSAVTPQVLNSFEFRNMGPFRAGAWITDFAVPTTPERAHRYTFYVGTRNGGVWKTENNGATFRPIFDATGQQSIGAVAVAPSDEKVVWVGTGESFVVRYSYPGDGVYKSTDAGATWQHISSDAVPALLALCANEHIVPSAQADPSRIGLPGYLH